MHRIGRTGRMGNPRTSPRLLNDKNRNLTKDLVELIVEANQDLLPSWLEAMSLDSRNSGRRGGEAEARRGFVGGRDFFRYENGGKGGGGGGGGGRSRGGGYSEVAAAVEEGLFSVGQ